MSSPGAVRHPVIRAYLCGYNTLMFLIHFFVFVDLANEHWKGTYNYKNHFETLQIATALQLMDILHAAIGWTKTSVANGLVQVFGRLFILHLAMSVEYQHTHITVSIMLFAYMLIELVRYPYYILRALDKDWYPVTWMRYNAWIVLYPTGMAMEFMCLIRCFAYHYQFGTYGYLFPSWVLGRRWVVAGACSIFIGMVFPFLTYNLLSYMYEQRKKKFGAFDFSNCFCGRFVRFFKGSASSPSKRK